MLGLFSPLPRSRTVHAVSAGVGVLKIGRALALVGGGIFYLVEGAVALLGGVVEDLGDRTGAGALGSGDGAWVAADVVGACFAGACGADAFEEVFVEDHAFGAACQFAILLVSDAECVGEGDDGKEGQSCFVHDVN